MSFPFSIDSPLVPQHNDLSKRHTSLRLGVLMSLLLILRGEIVTSTGGCRTENPLRRAPSPVSMPLRQIFVWLFSATVFTRSGIRTYMLWAEGALFSYLLTPVYVWFTMYPTSLEGAVSLTASFTVHGRRQNMTLRARTERPVPPEPGVAAEQEPAGTGPMQNKANSARRADGGHSPPCEYGHTPAWFVGCPSYPITPIFHHCISPIPGKEERTRRAKQSQFPLLRASVKSEEPGATFSNFKLHTSNFLAQNKANFHNGPIGIKSLWRKEL
jgi:hypothetical protein